MKKILFVSNIAGKAMKVNFCLASIEASKKLNIEFHTVANRSLFTKKQMLLDGEKYGVKLHHADICRSPFSLKNFKALRQINKLIRDEKIDYIHCNTPVGGMLGRICGKLCGVKKVIYQAHGFHFYDGAPKKNWLLYYPVERLLAHWTDAIITINKEDYERAQSFKLRNGGKAYYVPGVGMELTQKHVSVDRAEKKKEIGVPKDAFLAISTGDLIERKNFRTAIKAIAETNERVHLVICGTGPQEDMLKALAKDLGVSDRIHLLGFRTDIKKLLAVSNVFLFTSFQEGLSRSLMEAMAEGLPCVASRIRGNTDLLGDDSNMLFAPTDHKGFAEAINGLANDNGLCEGAKAQCLTRIKDFSIEKVTVQMTKIYDEVLKTA